MRLLMVEDSERLRETVALGLRKAGYAVDTAEDGPTGLWHAQSHPYDVIILDIMLPGLNGLDLLKRLRAAGQQTHILLLTARDAVEDRVAGLRSGADDYLVKPFAFDELLARVEALTRRQHAVKDTSLSVGGLKINFAAREVSRGDASIELAAREFALLEYLVMRRGTVISRTELESHLYDANAELSSNVVDAAVYALRRRIDLPGQQSIIRTRRGMGYWIAAEGEEHIA